MRTMLIKFSGFVMILMAMNACTTAHPKHNTAYQDSYQSLETGIKSNQALNNHAKPVPESVSAALIPAETDESTQLNQINQHRFNVVADKIPARAFFAGLVEGTNVNMIVNPDVSGFITMNLKNVTLAEAMDAVRDIYGYEYRQTSYGFEVLPQALESQIYNVNYLDVKRIGKSTTSVASGEVTNKISTSSSAGNSGIVNNSPISTNTSVTGTVDTTSEANFWHDLKKTLETMIGSDKGRSVLVNPQAGVVIVHAYPNELQQVGSYLDRIQSNLQRQVILEAKIIEVTLSDDYEAGIDWSLFGNPSTGNALVSQSGNNNVMGNLNNGAFSNTNLNSFDSIFTISYKGALGMLMRFLQTQGNVQVLSSPRISTVNNQKAVIKVGQDEFFVTGVSTSNTVVGSSTIPSQQVDLTPFFSGITLDVTPQISKDGAVILHVHPAVSEVTSQQKSVNLGSNGSGTPNNLVLPLALSTIRESDNIVRAKNGEVVVIGGLMQNSMTEVLAGTPGLSKIPYLGALFRRTSQVAGKTELIILIRPILVQNQTMIESLQQSKREIQTVSRGFHSGGLPSVFGNEGEKQDL